MRKAAIAVLLALMLLPLTGAATSSASSADETNMDRAAGGGAGGIGTLSVVTWTIHFDYWNESRSPYAASDIPGAKVELWRGSDWLPSATAYTNTNGVVSFSVDTGYTYKAKIFAEDGHTNVVTHYGNLLRDPITWLTDSFSFSGNRNTDWHIYTDKDHYQAWSWYCNVRHAHRWFEAQTGWNCPSVVSYGWSPTATQVRMEGGIHIDVYGVPPSNDLTSKGTAYHEWSHCVMYYAEDQWLVSTGSGHQCQTETDPERAYIEGWAEFMEGAVDNEPSQNLLEFGWNNECWAEYVDKGDWDGSIVEGAVAQTFWDILDGWSPTDKYAWSHAGDHYQASMYMIFGVLSYYNTHSITEFYAKWNDNFSPGYEDYDLKTILDTNRIVDWNGDRTELFEGTETWTQTKSATNDPNPAWITCDYSTTRSVSSSHSMQTSFTSGPSGYDSGTAVAYKQFTATTMVPKISVKMYVSAYYHDHFWATEVLDAGIRMRLYNPGGSNYATYTYWLACWYGSNDYRTNPDPSTIKIVYNKPTMSTWLNPVVYPTQDFPNIAWSQCSYVQFELYLATSGAHGDQFAAYYDDFTFSKDTVERTDNFEVVNAWLPTFSSGNGDYTWLTNTYTTSRYHSSSHSVNLGFSNGPVNYDYGSVTRYKNYSTNYVDTISIWMYVSTYQHDGNPTWDTMDSGIRIRLYNSGGSNYATYTYWLACWYHGSDTKTPSDPSTTKLVWGKPTMSTWLNPVLHPSMDFSINWGSCTKVKIELYSAGAGTSLDYFQMYMDDFDLKYATA